MATPTKEERGNIRSLIPLDLCMEGASINLFTGEIHLPPEVTGSMQTIERRLIDMQSVFFNSDLLINTRIDPKRKVHQIYRFIGDTESMVHVGLKYDITVVLPGDWGLQLPTTTGHYHVPLGKNKMASPDFYQLLYGQALAMLQRETPEGTEVKLLKPQPGEWMLFPPPYAHAVVNIGHEPAVFANICVRQPHLNYEPILSKRGMAYYILRGEENGYRLVKNERYERVLTAQNCLCALKPPGLEDLVHTVPFYHLLTHYARGLEFLTAPDRFPEVFDPDPIQSLK